MPEKLIVFITGSLLSLTAVLGDSFIKQASLQTGFSGWRWLLIGSLLYSSTAFGWFFVFRKMKLSVLAVIFGVTTVVFLTLVGVFYFNEKLTLIELIGIILGVISLLILYNYSE